jgi:large subunit ribosomal protein L7/L12
MGIKIKTMEKSMNFKERLLRETIVIVIAVTFFGNASKATEISKNQDVSAATPVAITGMAIEAAPAKEKTDFEVILIAPGSNKIQVIKEIRAITGLDLNEAKNLVEGAPKTLIKSVPKATAEEIKKKLEAVGATVNLK